MADALAARPSLSLAPLAVLLGMEVLVRDVLIAPRGEVTNAYILMGTLLWPGAALALLLGWWLPRVERAPYATLGFTPFRLRYVGLGAVAFVAVLFASGIDGAVLPRFGLEGLRSLAPVLRRLDLSARIGLLLAGTVFEEVVYRGYLIEWVTAWTGRLWMGAAASWLVFTAVHFRFFGLGPTIDTSILAAALVVLYVRERSLWPCFVLHGLNSILAYLLAPALAL